jgi:class 3 adenylate cyclase
MKSFTDTKTIPEYGSTENDEFEEIDLSLFLIPDEENNFIPQKEIEITLKKHGIENFQKRIESYYIHQQLADALVIKGQIPMNPVESTVGIGFIDIANYSYLSKWLSPKENQLVLNGLYSAFTQVIKEKGGFLNKIEGDSLMFHFGGIIDPEIMNMPQEKTESHIATKLFYTCIEIQRACQLFNEASRLFLDENTSPETKEAVEQAFFIISSLRRNMAMASGVDAKFQIKVRIGASIGEVSIGNFGPVGKKQWDIIGEPVIEARRMEATAPIGGLRISDHMYKILARDNVDETYYHEFKGKAANNNGDYADIKIHELFSFKEVILERKKNVHFKSYSVQVSADLPEQIAKQVCSFLQLGEEGADEILGIIQYYRGNRLVINAIENSLAQNNIVLNKIELLKILSLKKFKMLQSEKQENLDKTLKEHYTLFNILRILGAYQDRVEASLKPSALKSYHNETSETNYLDRKKAEFINEFKVYKRNCVYSAYFKTVLFPLMFRSIKADILSFRSKNI